MGSRVCYRDLETLSALYKGISRSRTSRTCVYRFFSNLPTVCRKISNPLAHRIPLIVYFFPLQEMLRADMETLSALH